MAMDALILIVNPGSTSKKYAVYAQTQSLAELKLEQLGSDKFVAHYSTPEKKQTLDISQTEFTSGAAWAYQFLSQKQAKFSKLKLVAVRLVAPGKKFARHQRVNSELISWLQDHLSTAPLHIKPILEEITQLKQQTQLELVAISDSAFHQDMPEVAKIYGIRYQDAQAYDIFRYGYHGLSVESVIQSLGQKCSEGLPERVIVAHLGGGASITAVKSGRSIDTSMGLTPLEGLLMSTRGGDLDDGALIQLAQRSGMNLRALEAYLNHQSGLLGVSQGLSSDVRVLLEAEAQGNSQAKRALDLFVYRIKKYIGSYIAVLGGLDVLAFTGTIGERSAPIRHRVLHDLDYAGFKLDQSLNQQTYETFSWINQTDSAFGCAVVPTNELGIMAKHASEFLK